MTAGCEQPVAGSHTSSVQKSPSLHCNGPPRSQRPAWQVPAVWQASAAGQAVPSCGMLWQVAAATQVSAVHGLPSLHDGSVAASTHPLVGSQAPVRQGPLQVMVRPATQVPLPSQR